MPGTAPTFTDMEESQGALNMVLNGSAVNATVIGSASGSAATAFEANEIWDMVCDKASLSLRIVNV